jgi:hypothetical protein
VELQLIAKRRSKEVAEINHGVEVRVFQQKVRHLTFEQAGTSAALTAEAAAEVASEEQAHLVREAGLRGAKGELRERIRALEVANAEVIRQLRVQQDRSLQTVEAENATALGAMQARYEARLAQLGRDLRLRLKVDLHEVEERKNLHIHQLSRAHEEAFGELRRYYNDITRANLAMMGELKAQIGEAGHKAANNQRLVLEMAEENKRLSEPLQRAMAERAQLQADLRDAARDKASLAYARTRLRELRAELGDLQRAQGALEARYSDVTAERDALYERFEATVLAAAARAEARSSGLETKLAEAEAAQAEAAGAAAAVARAAALDPTALAVAEERVGAALGDRAAAIRSLQEAIGKLRKAHDDAVRSVGARLVALGGAPGTAAAGATAGLPELLNPRGFPGPAGLIVAP